MNAATTRRHFLKTAAGTGALLGLGDLGFLSQLRPVSAAEAKLEPDIVRFNPEIEPLVRLLEDTPRERLLEEVAARIKRGLSYRDLLAALLLAGVRNIQPRPVGFKFHAVLVVNSAHLASLSSPDSDRWLPIFWALDHFKSSQAQDVKEGDWTMRAVDESKIPRRLAGRKTRSGGNHRDAASHSTRLSRGHEREGGGPAQPRRRAAVHLGRFFRRRGRVVDARAGHPVDPRCDRHKRASLCLAALRQ